MQSQTHTEAMGVCPDSLLFQVADKTMTKPGTDPVGLRKRDS